MCVLDFLLVMFKFVNAEFAILGSASSALNIHRDKYLNKIKILHEWWVSPLLCDSVSSPNVSIVINMSLLSILTQVLL